MKKETSPAPTKVKLKVKVRDLNKADLKRAGEITINKIKAYLKAKPFATKMDLQLALKLTPSFMENHVICCRCGHVEEKGSYAIAQKAMGYPVIFNCDCGNKINC